MDAQSKDHPCTPSIQIHYFPWATINVSIKSGLLIVSLPIQNAVIASLRVCVSLIRVYLWKWGASPSPTGGPNFRCHAQKGIEERREPKNTSPAFLNRSPHKEKHTHFFLPPPPNSNTHKKWGALPSQEREREKKRSWIPASCVFQTDSVPCQSQTTAILSRTVQYVTHTSCRSSLPQKCASWMQIRLWRGGERSMRMDATGIP